MSCLRNCSHCESFSISSLRSRIAFFSESDSTPRALPFSSSQGPARKKQRGRGFEWPETNELTSAQCPCASPSPQREDSPVLFTQPDQRPSAAASDMFGGSDDEMDDSLSLAASDAGELSGSVTDPALLPPSSSRSARPRTDEQTRGLTCCHGTTSPQRNGRSTRSRFRESGEVFGRARVDLFASEDNSHCPIYFTRSTDALAHEWPSLPLYGTSSLKRKARYGIHGPSYGPCMCGRSTGAFRPPRACLKHYGRS